MFILYGNFVSVQVLQILFPYLNEDRNLKIIPELHQPPEPPNVWNKPHLFTYTSLRSLPQSHLQTLSRSSYRDLLGQKFGLPKSASSKNHVKIKNILKSSQFTEYARIPSITSNTVHQI